MINYLQKLGEHPSQETLNMVDIEIDLSNRIIDRYINLDNQEMIQQEELYLREAHEIRQKIIMLIGEH